MAAQLELIEQMGRWRDGVEFGVAVGGAEGAVVEVHGGCLSCRRTGRADRGLHGDPLARGGDGFGPAGPERSGGWQPGNYFVWRCKAGRAKEKLFIRIKPCHHGGGK